MGTVILGLLVFTALVVVHEFGHFWVARRLGVRVERFSIGFGPVVLRRIRDGVEYAVSAFPLGGYVKMAGDDPRNRDALRPGDFFLATWWRRVLIALAGPGANFLFAILLGIALAWIGFRTPDAASVVGRLEAGSAASVLGFRQGDAVVAVDGAPVGTRSEFWVALLGDRRDAASTVRLTRDGAPVEIVVPADGKDALGGSLVFFTPAAVGEVVNGSPAYRAGLQVGDTVTAVGDEPIPSWLDLTTQIRANPGTEIVLTVSRDGKLYRIPVTPLAEEENGERIGRVGILAAAERTYVQRFGVLEGVGVGARVAVGAAMAQMEGIARLFTSASGLGQISGPVAIIQASGSAARAGIDALLNFALIISVALMVFNLLPIPILDGGMVALSVLEGLRRRPVGGRGLAIYQGIGMAVIGTLLLFVLVNDPLRMLQRRAAIDRVTEVAP